MTTVEKMERIEEYIAGDPFRPLFLRSVFAPISP